MTTSVILVFFVKRNSIKKLLETLLSVVSLKTNMSDFNVGNESIELECEVCKSKLKATVKQFAEEVIIKCPNCGESYKLKAKDDSAREVMKKVDELNRKINEIFK